MKIIAGLIIASSVLSTPLVSFAQTTAPITRAEVRAQLIRLEQAGYSPSSGDEANYPADIQVAEAKIDWQGNQQMVNSGAGGTTMKGASAAGSRNRLPKPAPSACVGPASFCTPYFGS
ncbi:DUF4148 domain-containing protein (plasmid) [Burkholderia sp. M6-3]